jgi:hypothetical protein
VLETDQGGMPCRFVKNEYVWATSAEVAESQGSYTYENRRQSRGRQLNGPPLQLVVDEIERGSPAWKLAFDGSFGVLRSVGRLPMEAANCIVRASS